MATASGTQGKILWLFPVRENTGKRQKSIESQGKLREYIFMKIPWVSLSVFFFQFPKYCRRDFVNIFILWKIRSRLWRSQQVIHYLIYLFLCDRMSMYYRTGLYWLQSKSLYSCVGECDLTKFQHTFVTSIDKAKKHLSSYCRKSFRFGISWHCFFLPPDFLKYCLLRAF